MSPRVKTTNMQPPHPRDYKASGILPMTIRHDEVYVLLLDEQRTDGHFWIDIGGRREPYDPSSWATAQRECKEELNGALKVSKAQIVRWIWHPQCKYVSHIVYLDDRPAPANTAWFPLSQLINQPTTLNGLPVHPRLQYVLKKL